MEEWTPPPPETLAANLVALLDVEEIDTDLYRGARLPDGRGRVFGGQVIAQALQAAQRSVDDKDAHSLHAYFMRAGDENFPIIYRVVRDYDGKSFANRRVIALQRGQPILNMIASFQAPEEGLHHQDPIPDVPGPETLKSESELRRDAAEDMPEKFRAFFLRRASPIDIRPLHPRSWFKPVQREPRNASWFRVVAPIGDDPAMHRAVLAYASDMALMATSMMPHGVNWTTPGMQSASLDHVLWLHEPVRADEWMLYATDSPWAGHGRGMNRGSIFSQDGRLVASVAQEGLIRLRQPKT
ncbi:acyl-CoA thioesterase II [Sphingomonas sp.]|jgi:acyl-CoA thioesterase-2|uniref:acyl-CoA thioesterase n=1 Tax=Sphingomonas sp. TaxID=28214 RepID=UPI002D7FE391|nr:acyl-CoA thioesterase II [Sphingomonas sp.]HEU0044608.1 acyl-CoA thioesterase II [Sphingomonas sp.]